MTCEDECFTKYRQKYPSEKTLWKKIRCAYGDYLKKEFEMDMIVGNFNKVDQPYQPTSSTEIFNLFLLQYTEVQICIFNTDVIRKIQIKEL